MGAHAWAAAVLLASTPVAAANGTLQLWEGSSGAPGVTASFEPGTAQVAELSFAASSAEGGALFTHPTEIEIRPTGSVAFTGFACQLPGCSASDYVFVPGDASASARVVVSVLDGDELHGALDLGAITFDAPHAPGTIELVRCNYTDASFTERTCAPFTLATLPEPHSIAALVAGAALLLALSRRR